MSTELLSCPFCGSEAKNEIDMPWRFVQCCECMTTGPETYNAEEAIAAWNRRFVCLDRNGKKVFAGDKVKGWLRPDEVSDGDRLYDKGTIWWDDKMLLWRLAIAGHKYTKKQIGVFYDSIELIESDGAE